MAHHLSGKNKKARGRSWTSANTRHYSVWILMKPNGRTRRRQREKSTKVARKIRRRKREREGSTVEVNSIIVRQRGAVLNRKWKGKFAKATMEGSRGTFHDRG